MTITDEDIYRLAKNIELIRLDFPDLSGMAWTERHNFNDVEALRKAVLQRFKPREPRVIECWGVVDHHNNFATLTYKDEDESREWFRKSINRHPDSYLAKAVITEVMEDAE